MRGINSTDPIEVRALRVDLTEPVVRDAPTPMAEVVQRVGPAAMCSEETDPVREVAVLVTEAVAREAAVLPGTEAVVPEVARPVLGPHPEVEAEVPLLGEVPEAQDLLEVEVQVEDQVDARIKRPHLIYLSNSSHEK